MRRYFSFRNFIDAFKVPIGILQCLAIAAKFKPQVIFSKGGYVSVPGVIACGIINFFRKILRREQINLLVHESDAVPGMANKIGAKFADKVLVSFEESLKYFKFKGQKVSDRVLVTGNPVRPEIFKGEREKGFKLCGFNKFKPVILAMGGSLGAMQINNLVWENLEELLKKYQVVHVTGKGNLNFGLKKPGYKQFELLYEELKDVYSISDLVITRGGANALSEAASLHKKAVVIPLGMESSRGDQITNARICGEKYGWQVLFGEVTADQFLRAIEIAIKEDFKEKEIPHKKASKKIVDLIYENLTN